jgi:hypothetical protein
MAQHTESLSNPYRPGAGHMPPYLAGRTVEYAEFDSLLKQETILENMVLTGLRGLGKTVLLETLRGRAIGAGWLWAGTDLSESASLTETSIATRLITDLALVTSTYTVTRQPEPTTGFSSGTREALQVPVSFAMLSDVYDETPGLTADRLKAVLMFAYEVITGAGHSGRLIFAYDEAQNLTDAADKGQFPLSVLLEVFQTIQRRGVPFMLLLTGLPTLFSKLVDTRTYAERMFRVITLDRLSETESYEAITKPLEDFVLKISEESIQTISSESGGYPYFIQFICREVFDVFIRQIGEDSVLTPVPIDAIQRKLDSDFFAGRWSKVTDRQRQLLYVAARLDVENEFTVQEISARSYELLDKGFSPSHANQMLKGLTEHGLIYKNRFGKYSFSVPLLDKFIMRVSEHEVLGITG